MLEKKRFANRTITSAAKERRKKNDYQNCCCSVQEDDNLIVMQIGINRWQTNSYEKKTAEDIESMEILGKKRRIIIDVEE